MNILARLAAALSGAEPAPAPADDKPAPVDAVAEYKKNGDQLRDTAKWLLTSFAAVGALLLGSIQLSSLGKLTNETPDSRIVAAILGIFFGALGVAIAIWWTSKVLAPMLNTFSSANQHPAVTTAVLDDKELVGEDYEGLKTKIGTLDRQVAQAADDEAYKKAYALRDEWERNKRTALAAVGNAILWERYKSARRAVLIGIACAAAGMASFAWGANPPDAEKKATPVVLGQAPLPLKLHLTPAGAAALKEARKCETADLAVLSIGGSVAQREVVAVPTGTCKTVRFVLTPELGTATAASPAPAPKAKTAKKAKKAPASRPNTVSTP